MRKQGQLAFPGQSGTISGGPEGGRAHRSLAPNSIWSSIAGGSQMVPHSLNVVYSDGESQVLWEDGERVFRRGWRLGDDGKRRAVLLVGPAADHLSRANLDRLEHEFELKDELDRSWAVRPLD